MRRWALLLAALYGLILAALTIPGVLLAFAPLVRMQEAAQLFLWPPYWFWLAAMLVAQAGLLAVPVRIASRHPVTQGALWLPAASAGLLAGLLAAGAVFSCAEFYFGEETGKGDPGPFPGILTAAVVALVVVWGAWAIVFHRLAVNREPRDFVSRQSRALLKGSILELLIAVPTHIIARSRDYCCAGFMTFIGLVFGFSVMLFAFGPAVFFLYADRWRKLHPPPQLALRQTTTE